jgi:hypothetical protein
MHDRPFDPPSANPTLRYIAILSAARDFGLSSLEIERVAGRFDPITARPSQLADALADELLAGDPWR